MKIKYLLCCLFAFSPTTPLPSLPRAFFGYSQSNVITFGINNNNNNFEELAVKKGRHSIIKDAKKYAEELDLRLLSPMAKRSKLRR